jgi:hypothetical protein
MNLWRHGAMNMWSYSTTGVGVGSVGPEEGSLKFASMPVGGQIGMESSGFGVSSSWFGASPRWFGASPSWFGASPPVCLVCPPVCLVRPPVGLVRPPSPQCHAWQAPSSVCAGTGGRGLRALPFHWPDHTNPVSGHIPYTPGQWKKIAIPREP